LSTTTAATEPVTKAAFVTQHLKADPGLPHAEINKAWQKRGGEGTISGTTFARAKARAVKLGSATKGKPGRKPGSPNKRKVKVALAASGLLARPEVDADKTGDIGILYWVEEKSDEVMFALHALDSPNKPDVLESLRIARRLCIYACREDFIEGGEVKIKGA
jgi:hypothetical protein